MSKYSTAFVVIAFGFFCVQDPQKQFSTVTLGTHAPKSLTSVWRVIGKGSSASACPVKMKDKNTVLFLTCKHVSKAIAGNTAIVQTQDKSRKLKIIAQHDHPTADLAVLEVAIDDKPVALFKLAPDYNMEPGLCVWSAGFAFPKPDWCVFRGYLSMTAGVANVRGGNGMSGGALTFCDGTLGGLIAAGRGNRKPLDVYSPDWSKKIGFVVETTLFREQTKFVHLFPYKKWLTERGVL